MTRENAKLLWPIIKAYGDGAIVQMKVKMLGGHRWEDEIDSRFDSDPDYYRIKPQPREFWIQMDGLGLKLFTPTRPSNPEHWIHVREVEP